MEESEVKIDAEIDALGARLRALRSAKGWTLEELAERSGLSKGFLSRLETGDRQPSIAAVLTLAQVFNVAMTSLFEQPASDHSAIVVRAASDAGRESNGLFYASLSNSSRSNLQPLRIVIPASRQGSERYHHEGEEWLYVLDGKVRLSLGDKQYQLHPGDSAHFDSRQPHRLDAMDDRDATLILVACSIPTSLYARSEMTAMTAGLAG